MSHRPLSILRRAGDDPAELRGREWLATNGLGGFASGTLIGPPTRRYHGLFVPNLSDPKGRFVMIPRIDEEIAADAGEVCLGGAEFCDGRRTGELPSHLREFRLDAMTPTWIFEIDGSVIEKTVVMPHGQNTVCVAYRLLEGPPRRLRLRLFGSCRRLDEPLVARDEWPFNVEMHGARIQLVARDGDIAVRMRVRPDAAPFVAAPREEHDVLFAVERERGYDHSETMFSPGYFECELARDTPASLVATTEAWETLDLEPERVAAAERERMQALVERAAIAPDDDFAAHLVMAADQFIVVPGSRREEALLASAAGDEVRSVMAGYHWFNDWGRDTMIALEGLTLSTGRPGEARAILRTFAHYIRDGLLPNLFPEGGREALYHTVDATLWYFHALDRYLAHSGDDATLAALYPQLQSVIEHHRRGTRFTIGADPADGLIRAAADGYQLTWMDAKVGDWVVTPRRGKPVEIQALWYNALRLMEHWGRRLGVGDADAYASLAAQVHASFNRRFWQPQRGFLIDVVDGPSGDDASLRPNQVFTMSLRHPVLEPEHRESVLSAVEKHLLTPVGLRTLDREHPDYQKYYEGSLRARDAAYHQGTVWPWLLGHFVDAWIRVHGHPGRARVLLQAFPEHLLEAGVGSISEIFDAEPPHRPRGCIAQAWSVAEILRAWLATGVHTAGAKPAANR